MRRAERIAKLEAQVAKLKAQEEAENPVFVPERGEPFWFLTSLVRGIDGDLLAPKQASRLTYRNLYPGFRTKEAAEAWAEAILVMLELRAQPGVVPFHRGAWTATREHDGIVYGAFFPTYETKAAAKAALQSVGEERVAAAARTLAWVDGGGI